MRDVCTLHSGRIASHGNSIIASGGSTPTIVAVPRTARLSIAWRHSFALPTASNAWSTPSPPVMARIAFTGSPWAELTVWVAPRPFAISSLESNWSTAMICRAAARTLHYRQPDAAHPEYGHRLAGAHAGGPQRGSHAGQHATSHQRGPVE